MRGWIASGASAGGAAPSSVLVGARGHLGVVRLDRVRVRVRVGVRVGVGLGLGIGE